MIIGVNKVFENAKKTNEKLEFDLKIADDDKFTVEELTNEIGVGKWHILAVCSVMLSILAENTAI